MSGVNKVIIIGRLGTDPETKTVSSGQAVTRMSVATSESWVDREGQKQEKTEWHRIVVWGKLAEICSKYLAKGRQVFVEGRLQTRSWEDNQGQKKYTTEIIATNVQFLGAQNSDSQAQTSNNSAAFGSGSSSNTNPFDDFGPEPSFNSAEEIPF